MAAAGFLQVNRLDNANSRQALQVAYEDVRNAFLYMLSVHPPGEPIVLVGHSQGSVLALRLLKEFFHSKSKFKPLLGAAYLPGWTVFEEELNQVGLEVCTKPDQVGCVISWRTFARGAHTKAFLHRDPPEGESWSKRVCTNPLSWRTDLVHVDKSENLGGLQVMHYRTMFNYLVGFKSPKDRVRPPPLIPHVSDAQCDEHGNLIISPPSHFGYGWGIWPFPAWTFASFPGQNLHTYDFNFFFANVRQNVEDRINKWHS